MSQPTETRVSFMSFCKAAKVDPKSEDAALAYTDHLMGLTPQDDNGEQEKKPGKPTMQIFGAVRNPDTEKLTGVRLIESAVIPKGKRGRQSGPTPAEKTLRKAYAKHVLLGEHSDCSDVWALVIKPGASPKVQPDTQGLPVEVYNKSDIERIDFPKVNKS